MSQAMATGLHKDALAGLGIGEDLFSSQNMKPVFFNAWTNQIQLIEHLVLFSNVLMVMSAERGTGKTTFAKLLVNTLPKDIACIELSAKALALDPEELIRVIGKALKCSINGEFLSEKLESLYRQAKSINQHWLFVIDDADLLTEDNLRIISELIALSRDNEAHLHFFLLGHQRLKAKVRELSLQMTTCQYHTLELAALRLEEIRLYLNHCYAHIKGEAAELPITDAELNSLKESSHGNIAYLKVSARELLNKKFSAKPDVIKAPISIQPKKIAMFVTSFLGVALIASFFMTSKSTLNYERTALQPKSLQQDSNYQPINFAHVQDKFERSSRLQKEENKKTVLAPISRDDGQTHFTEKPLQVVAPVKSMDDTFAISEEKGDVGLNEPTEEEAIAAIRASRKALAEKKPVVLDNVVIVPTELAKPVLIKPAKKVNEVIQNQVSIKEAKKQSPLEKKPLVEPIAKISKTDIKPPKKTRQIAVRELNYAIQLIGASSLDSVKTFVYQRKLQHQVMYYKTQHNGKAWYVAVMGPYKDKDSAKEKLNALPSNVKKHTPWVRSTKGLGSPKKL